MSLELVLNALDAALILGVSIPSAVMAARIKVPKLRTLGVLLASFLAIHGAYHLFGVLSATYGGDLLDFLPDGLLEPISYVVLMAFGVYLYRLGE